MSDFTRPAEELLEKARTYADSKADEVKLQVAKGLSVTLSKLVSLLIIVFLGFTLLMVLAFGLNSQERMLICQFIPFFRRKSL